MISTNVCPLSVSMINSGELFGNCCSFYDYALQTLVNGDTWAPAVEQAIGKLLNAFIVTNSKDASALRTCAKEARYNYFPIVIHEFSRPR